MLIIAFYTFAKILSKLVEVILRLLLASSILYLTLPALLIMYTFLLLITKRYIIFCNRDILTKIRKTSFTLQNGNIKKANLILKINFITNLAIHLEFIFKYLFRAKNNLYIIKKMIGLQITYKKSIMT